MQQPSFFVTAPRNLEDLLAEELKGLGLATSGTHGGVAFEGTVADACRVCLWSRIANRVLMKLAVCPADTSEALYSGIRAIDWDRHLGPDDTFAVALNAARSRLTHTHYGALKVKDAIVDHFRATSGRRPSVDTEQPNVRVNVRVWRNEATVALDLSGQSLHRRGYRQRGVAAPLKENLAAAILMRAGWPEMAAAGAGLVDPMCGSGTLVIEAALMAADIAPGLERRHWGFTGWKGHDTRAWAALVADARERRDRGLDRLGPIQGYDVDRDAVRTAIANVERAGLTGRVHIERRDVALLSADGLPASGLVVTNPPYGERIGGPETLDSLYGTLGQRLRDRFPGWRAAVMTGDPALGHALGMRAVKVHTLYNGRIECRLLHFDLAPEALRTTGGAPRPLAAEQRSDAASMFENRLRKNEKKLRKWRSREGITCYRLYDRDLPEYAVVVDVYEGDRRRAHVQEYAAPRSVDARRARMRLREALGVVVDVLELGDDDLYVKRRRRQRGKSQYDKLAETGRFHEVAEGPATFLVNLSDYLDTGLFLDHRKTRRLVSELAAGGRFLNLFCYTGTATVCAALGGATASVSVDMSRTYIDWARRNFRLNGLDPARHRLVQADCLSWLASAGGKDRYDAIFLDPPSFSTSKRMSETLDVQRDHADLIRRTMTLLAPDGVLVFSCNRRGFRLDDAVPAAYDVEEVTRSTIPKDFERHPGVHACFLIRNGSSGRSRSRAGRR